MKTWNINANTVSDIVCAVSRERYGNNLIFKRLPERAGKAVQFTLTVRSASGPGGRRSNTGRKIAAACWHAHRDVMSGLFEVCPDMRLKTARVDYRGREDFEDKFEDTGYVNIGSGAEPCNYRDACECTDENA